MFSELYDMEMIRKLIKTDTKRTYVKRICVVWRRAETRLRPVTFEGGARVKREVYRARVIGLTCHR